MVFHALHVRFSRFARVFFILVHLAALLVLSKTRNDLSFCSVVDDVST